MENKQPLMVVILLSIASALNRIARHITDEEGLPAIDSEKTTAEKFAEMVAPEKVVQCGKTETIKDFVKGVVDSNAAQDAAAIFDSGVILDDETLATAEFSGPEQPQQAQNFTPPPPEAAAALASPEGVDVDEEGLPWDVRIHASSKKKLLRGNTWKLIRNIDPALVATVKGELRALMTASTATATATARTTATPPTEAPPPPPPPPAATGGITTLAQLVEAATKAGKTPVDLKDACKAVGIGGVPLLASSPNSIPAVAKILGLS